MGPDSARLIAERLIEVMAARAGLEGQVSISHATPLQALREFCYNGAGSPDIVIVTHRLHGALAAECAQNGARQVAGVELARSALVLAVRRGSALTNLTTRQVYLAIARDVPYRDGFTRNTNIRWSDVEPNLPGQDIRFQLPMREEGSRAAFDALVMQGGCRDEDPVRRIYDAQQRRQRCISMRSDRVRELPRPQAAKALLDAPLGTVGVMTRRELAQAEDQLVGLTLDGVAPTTAAIRDGVYDFSTSLWLYGKTDRPGAAEIVAQAQSETTIGPDGPLLPLGLVPLPAEEREAQRATLAAVDGYSLAEIAGWISVTATNAWRMFGVGTSRPMPDGETLDFTSLMDAAGYQISSIESSIGIIPDAAMNFGIAREMSDADHLFIERMLTRDSLNRPGPIAAIQRRIIRSILSVREVGSFEVSKVSIDFLPLPKIVLVVRPKGNGGHDSEGE